MGDLQLVQQNKPHQRACQVAASRIPGQDNLLGPDVEIFADVLGNEGIDSKAVVGGSGKAIRWGHPIVDGEDGNLEFPGPLAGVGLHGSARQRQEPPSMHVHHYCRYLTWGLSFARSPTAHAFES